MSANVSRTSYASSEKAGLALIAVAVSLIAYAYLFSDNKTTFILKYPLATSLNGFAQLRPERKITSVIPLPGHSGCYNKDTNELVVCVWMAQTKLRETRFNKWLRTI